MRTIFLLPFALLACSGSDDPVAETTAEDTGAVSTSDGTAADDTATTAPDAPNGDSGGPADGAVASDAAPAGGCGKAATAGVSNGSITVAGTERTYVLAIPTGYDPTKPLPLVFAWHGRTGNGTQFRSYSGVEKSSAGKAIVVYPNGLPVTTDPKDTGWVLTAAGRDVAFFDALVTDLSSKLCVDSARIMSFGFSFGGYMSNALACHRSSVVRAIGVSSSGGPSGTCGSAVPAWIAHAEDDGTVLFTEGTKTRDAWLKKNTCATTTKPVTPDPCVSYDGCAKPVIWCATATGGHSWPSYAPNAIWSFFASF